MSSVIAVSTNFYGFGAIPTTNSTTATYNGVTFTFNTAMPVGYYRSGEPFVVSTGAFTITAISPASAVVDLYQAHGAMQDPLITTTSQGFDAMIGQSGISALDAAIVPYVPALNVDPAVNGAISISAGQETSIVKAVRRTGATTSDWWSQEKYVVLTVVAAAPTLGAIRPAPSELGTKTHYNIADINLSVLRSLTMPASFSESAATSLSYVPKHLGVWGSEGGEKRRRFRLDEGLSGSNYSAVITPYYARAILQLHNAATPMSAKFDIAERVIEHGAQIAALVNRGAALGGGAGQGGGLTLWMWAAAFLLKNSAIASVASPSDTQIVSPFWWAAADVGKNGWDKAGETGQVILPEFVGMPTIVPDAYQSNLPARYTYLGASNVYWEVTPLLPFQNWNGDWTSRFVGGAYDTTNPKAAVVALLDRARTWTNPISTSYNPPAQWQDIYDTVRGLSSMSVWTGQPDQIPYGTAAAWDDDYFTAGDGAISWDFKSVNFATEAITRRDFRYSLDAVQWIEVSDVATTGTQPGLLKGAAHWCGLRHASASGNSAWSLNYPAATPITSGTDRGKRTTTGTDTAAAPVNTVAPLIHKRIYELWDYPLWEPAGASLTVDDTVYLSAGVGYWTGYPAPTFTYQWKRNGVNISGETSKTYTRKAADAETDITCEVTATNASGSASVTTAAVTMPALTVIPAGTIIDTNFAGSFLLDYETEWNAIYAGNCTKGLLGGYGGDPENDDVTSLNVGALWADKTGADPYIAFPLSRAVTAGSSYRVQAQLYSPSALWTNGKLRFDLVYGTGPFSSPAYSYLDQKAVDWLVSPWLQVLESGMDPTSDGVTTYDQPTYRGTVTRSGYIIDIDITFDVASGETSLYPTVYFGHSTSTGGTAAGDAYLTYLKISEVV